MKVAILAGGLGTRLAEETDVRPKPMVEVGGRPILWHIMKHYAHYGFNEFVVALGYKGESSSATSSTTRAQQHITVTLGRPGRSTRHDGDPTTGRSTWSTPARHADRRPDQAARAVARAARPSW